MTECPYCGHPIDEENGDDHAICDGCSLAGCSECMPNGLCEDCEDDADTDYYGDDDVDDADEDE